MKIDFKKALPTWWMVATEIALFVAAIGFLFDGKYLEGIASIILIELRDISWQTKSKR